MELLSRLLREFMCQVDSGAGAELTTADDTRRVFEAMDEAASKVLGLNKAWSHWEGRGRSEFLCDYSIRRESKLGPMIIALESEWGKQSSAKITLEEVIFDFEKLFHLTAEFKVMVFAYTDRPNLEAILSSLSKRITEMSSLGRYGCYACVAAPWDDTMGSHSLSAYVWCGSYWSPVIPL